MDGASASSEDCSKFTNFFNDDNIESIRDRFVTGDWSKAALRNTSSEVKFEDDDNVYADFEDLETGEKYEGYHAENTTDVMVQKAENSTIEERRLKKLALRAQFDAEYPFNELDCTCSFFFFTLFYLYETMKLVLVFLKCSIQILSLLLIVDNFIYGLVTFVFIEN